MILPDRLLSAGRGGVAGRAESRAVCGPDAASAAGGGLSKVSDSEESENDDLAWPHRDGVLKESDLPIKTANRMLGLPGTSAQDVVLGGEG